MWIDIKDKNNFQDSSKLRGLRITFDKKIEQNRIAEVKRFADWLRKRYYFPIRCDVHIDFCSYFEKRDNKDVDSVVDFYYKESTLPSIRIAAYPMKKSKDKDFYIQIQARLAYALTFYYQWFFYAFDERSDRSLKIEATKWQNYIMQEYMGKDNK